MERNVAVISLGCDKNRVDTEKMLYALNEKGYRIVADYREAHIIVVNTCAFIESAREEAIDTILEAAAYKKDKLEKLIVTGCLPKKHMSELKSGLPEVDAFLGIDNYYSLPQVIEDLSAGKTICSYASDGKDDCKRVVSTPTHYAFLKIADGCDNHCTFCTIPSIRGKYVSRSVESLLKEAKMLEENGVKELILVAQDVTRYGVDLYGEYKLVPLIKELSKLEFTWIRLMYCYPELVSEELIREIDENDKVAKYIDIPMQHSDDKILKLMNRRGSNADMQRLLNRLAACKNHIAVRTTFMVGFPGEEEDNFNNLCGFLEKYQIDNVGIFAYSDEDSAPSSKLGGKLSAKVKAQRVEKLGEIYKNIRLEKNKKLIGKTVRVLYESIDFDKNAFVGRTQYNAPDIDTVVYFTGEFADVGNFYDVKITDCNEYDLIGEILQ